MAVSERSACAIAGPSCDAHLIADGAARGSRLRHVDSSISDIKDKDGPAYKTDQYAHVDAHILRVLYQLAFIFISWIVNLVTKDINQK